MWFVFSSIDILFSFLFFSPFRRRCHFCFLLHYVAQAPLKTIEYCVFVKCKYIEFGIFGYIHAYERHECIHSFRNIQLGLNSNVET